MRSFDLLKSCGTVLAIAKHQSTVYGLFASGKIMAHHIGSDYITGPYPVPQMWDKTREWLWCQYSLKNKSISRYHLNMLFRLDRIEHGFEVYVARDLSCHKYFELYVTSSINLEVHCEII